MRQKYQKILESETSSKYLACGLWLFGCSCWVLSFMLSNHHKVAPQVTLLWRGFVQMLVSYAMVRTQSS